MGDTAEELRLKTDIVERLRMRDADETANDLIEIMHDAANEIERLRSLIEGEHRLGDMLAESNDKLGAEIERLRAEERERCARRPPYGGRDDT